MIFLYSEHSHDLFGAFHFLNYYVVSCTHNEVHLHFVWSSKSCLVEPLKSEISHSDNDSRKGSLSSILIHVRKLYNVT